MRPGVALLLSLLMAGVLVVLAVGSRAYYQRAAAEHFQQQIQTAEDDQVPQLLKRLSVLGEPGIRALVANLDSSRECVAFSARWVLLEQLARWREQTAAEALRQQSILAEALSQSALQFGPVGKQSAEQLAVRMLLEMPDGDIAQRQEIIEHCRRVLEAVGATARSFRGPGSSEMDVEPPLGDSTFPPRSKVSVHTGDSSSETSRETTGQPRRPFGSEAIPAELSPLPGGGLAPGSPIGQLGEFAASNRSDDGPLGGNERSEGHTNDSRTQAGNELRAVGPGELGPPERLPAPAQRPKVIPKGGNQPPADSGGGVRRLAGNEQIHAQSAHEVPGSAQADGPAVPGTAGWQSSGVAADAGKSGDRNWQPVEIEIARRAAHPDPQVRKQLVSVLPQLQAVDSVAWLLRLCEDADPEVRWEAITLLATSGNPAIRAQVRKLAQQDSNPRIRQLAEQLERH